MLQIGNGLLTDTEELTHFALWAFSKAPLIIGADLSTISTNSLNVLKTQALIDINQDQLGKQAKCSQGCTPVASSQVYQSLVYTSDKEGLQMGVLGVNWDDANPVDFSLDLV